MNLGKLCIDINKMFIIHHIFIITNITEIIVVIEVVTVGDPAVIAALKIASVTGRISLSFLDSEVTFTCSFSSKNKDFIRVVPPKIIPCSNLDLVD